MLVGKLAVSLRAAINWFSCTKMFRIPSQKLKQQHLVLFFHNNRKKNTRKIKIVSDIFS